MIVIGREDVARHLDYATCIGLVREAMIALAGGETRQLLRSILDLENIYINGGKRGFLVGIKPAAAATILKPVLVDIAIRKAD